MARLLLVLAAAGLLIAADEYDPKPDQLRFYRWTTTQDAEWTSAGDKLHYRSEIVWRLGLRCASVEGARMRLKATFVTVTASHQGPGIDVRLDSATGAGSDDPLLGHLMALVGATLDIDADRRTGAVATVGGGEAIIAAINQRAPATVPGDPPPLDAGARAAYGPEALARLWSQILALPGSGTEVALPAPFAPGSTMLRTWTGQAWTAALPTGAAPPAFELARDPTPVRGTVRELSGTGGVALSGGLTGRATGSLSFTLTFDALTQAADSRQQVSWEMVEIK